MKEKNTSQETPAERAKSEFLAEVKRLRNTQKGVISFDKPSRRYFITVGPNDFLAQQAVACQLFGIQGISLSSNSRTDQVTVFWDASLK
ncbi:hypothetical protein A2356_00150 [Candidatus Nomurabacteria bacterium RIFOXYB1_FULL_39_16]|uniref:Uncharacterized protein n=1 Tax=Candidatus Nomurabacteria bacterium RIFOXYB1_FULL_39_16 TaxID=1801803 RepID=A0A1F6YR75_9BACT|nr:MAG: hypothetical protein A2356_00150 [Candidatus Nomurabacteria bacterium RIFOXYB1_FULL_39_16]